MLERSEHVRDLPEGLEHGLPVVAELCVNRVDGRPPLGLESATMEEGGGETRRWFCLKLRLIDAPG